MAYRDYMDARNMAWQFLIEHEIYTFPVSIAKLTHELQFKINASHILDADIYSVNFTDPQGIVHILYKKHADNRVNRFTITHEIGHVLRGNQPKSEQEEEQANVFASRVLSPMILIKHHDLKTAESISEFFGISEEAAQIRADRFQRVDARNRYLSHPLEREYYFRYCDANKILQKIF